MRAISPLAVWRNWGPTARAIARGWSSGLLLSVSNRVIALASGVLLARALGVDSFGIYSLAVALASVVGTFVEFGLPTLLIREVSRSELDARAGGSHTVSGAVMLILGSSAIAASLVGIAFSIPLLIRDRGERAALVMIAALLPLSALSRILGAALMGRRRILQAQLVEFIVAPAIVLCGATALYMAASRPQAQQALLLQIVATAVGVACAVAWLRRSSKPEEFVLAHTGATLVSLAKAGFPFLLANVALLLSTQVDTVVVGVIGRPRDVGLYRVGAQGAVLCTFAIQVLQNVAAPFFARLHREGNSAAVRRLFRTVQGITTGFALALFLVFAVAGRQLIALLFGPPYVSAQPVLLIISVGYLLNAGCGPIGVLLSMTGHERAMSRIFWITAIANVGAAVGLGLLAGAPGVAVATAGSVAGYHVLMRLYARRTFRL